MEVGDTITIEVDIGHRSRKFAVCIAVSPNYILLVNSENRAMYNCIEYKKNGRDFPRHDSYIGCSNLFEPNGDYRVVGNINTTEAAEILEKIKTSKTITPKQKNEITPQLESYIAGNS